MGEFPKVLIIGVDPFNTLNGSGITLTNLFKGWEKNNIAQVYMSEIVPNMEVCSQFYRLSPKSMYVDYYFRKLLSSRLKSNNSSHTPAAINMMKEEVKNNIPFRLKLHSNIRAALDLSPMYIPITLIEWIQQFNPDIIYSTLGNARIVSLVNKISLKLKKPIVPHFMDDWISTLYTQNELNGLARILLNKKLKKLFSLSNGGLCISQLMADEYEKRYALSFKPFVNCVEDYLFRPPDTSAKNSTFILMYVGGLHLNRWKSLLNIAQAVERLNTLDFKLILKIYCPAKDKVLYTPYFEGYKSTYFKGSLSSEEVPAALQKASLLLHIESFEENFVAYTKFSLSTKIPQYLAAGKPVMGYGPKELASMKHIEKANAGILVNTKNIEKLTSLIQDFIRDAEKLNKYAANGFAYASSYHTKTYNLIQLKLTLSKYSNKKI